MITLICIFFILLILIFILYRFYLFQKISNTNQIGKFKSQENLLYDNYYLESDKKKNNKLICQLGIFRKYLGSSPLEYEINNLDLEPNKLSKILIISNYDLNLELPRKIIQTYPLAEIMITHTNLLTAKNLQDICKREGLSNITIAYTQPEDILNLWGNSDYKFNRILVRECLGNIKDRELFLGSLKKLLAVNGKIKIRTFTFEPIFEDLEHISSRKNLELFKIYNTQKKLIDYWNYNFSTTTSIINDISQHFETVKFTEIKFLNLFFLYNFSDFKKVLHIYFRDMGLRLNNLDDWRGLQTLKILFLDIS